MHIQIVTDKLINLMWRVIYQLSPSPISRRLKAFIPFGAKTTFIKLKNNIMFDNLDKSEIFKYVFWEGIKGYEFEIVKLFCFLAKESDTIFDIGSYIGYYSIIASKINPDVVIHSFEPVPDSVNLQKHFIKINSCNNIYVHDAAIDLTDASKEFFLPDKSKSKFANIGSLRNRFKTGETFSDRSYKIINVKCYNLDRFVYENKINKIDLIKIDTEETEIDVLLSGRKSIQQHKPDIIIEIIIRNKSSREAIAFLKEFGYRFFEIQSNNLNQIDEIKDVVNIKQPGRRAYCELLCSCKNDNEILMLTEKL